MIGRFSAFFDVAVGTTAPLVGHAVGHAVGQAGTPATFLIGAAFATTALFLIPALQRMAPARRRKTHRPRRS